MCISALEHDLEIIPVINKIDLPSADPDRVKHEIEDIIGLDASEAVLCSAKSGTGIPDILEAIVNKVPAPPDKSDEPTRALILIAALMFIRCNCLCARKEGTIKAKIPFA